MKRLFLLAVVAISVTVNAQEKQHPDQTEHGPKFPKGFNMEMMKMTPTQKANMEAAMISKVVTIDSKEIGKLEKASKKYNVKKENLFAKQMKQNRKIEEQKQNAFFKILGQERYQTYLKESKKHCDKPCMKFEGYHKKNHKHGGKPMATPHHNSKPQPKK